MIIRDDLTAPVKECIKQVPILLYRGDTIAQALQSLQRKPISEKIFYFYVVDKENRLQGIVSTRDLLTKDPLTLLEDIMQRTVLVLHEQQTLEEALEMFSNTHLLALPVVDAAHRLLGMIDIEMYVEEAIDLTNSQRRRDAFQLLGVTMEEGRMRSPWRSYLNRTPWIFCNLFGGIACAVISKVYQLVLGRVLILAMFIPLVLTLAESISMQSMTHSIHHAREKQLSVGRVLVQIGREGRVISLMSLSYGILVGLVSLFWGAGFAASWTIAAGLILSITASALIGASIPLLLHLKQLDPKVAAGPIVLMVVDVLTTGVYLSFANWWLL